MQEDRGSDYRLALAARNSRELTVSPPAAEPERSSINIFAVIWRRRWTILLCVIAALISGIVYLTKATPIYSSSSVIFVQQAVPKIISDEMSNGNDSIGYLYTQCQLIQSTAILGAALEVPGVADAECLKGMENPIGFLKSQVVAAPTKQGELIVVSMESTNPKDAAVIVNGVVEAYIDYQSKQHKSTAVEILRILQKEMDRHEAELQVAQQAMLDFKKENPELTLQTEKGSTEMTQYAEISEALSQAQLRALDLKDAVAEAKTTPNDLFKLRRLISRFQLTNEVPPVADSQILTEYQQQQAQIEDLLGTLGPKHDLVIRAYRQLDQLLAQLHQAEEQSAKDSLTVLQEASDDANIRVTQLEKNLDEERRSTVGLSVKEVEYEQLAQEAQRTERALDLLDSRMKEVNVTEDVGSLTVSVLETAKPDWAAVRPRRGQTLGIALVAGLMVGLGGALLRDMMDQRLRSAEEIASVLDLPILGGIPHIIGKIANIERGQEISLRPHSDVAEAYRTIRTAIYFGLSEEKNAKTILVTSPAPGDGKSTTISNLAIASAQAGRSVLIIDADCRRPVQHKNFKLHDGPGLSTLLAGKATLEQVIHKTNVEHLEILPCGALPHNPAELLNSQAFLDLLSEVSKRYDQILVDSPPVVPVTDARILAASCDVTVMVLRAERSTRKIAEHARDALSSVGANLLGVVVNDVPRGKEGYGYYYYGYGRYGYRQALSQKNGNGNGNGHGKVLITGTPVIAEEIDEEIIGA